MRGCTRVKSGVVKFKNPKSTPLAFCMSKKRHAGLFNARADAQFCLRRKQITPKDAAAACSAAHPHSSRLVRVRRRSDQSSQD